MHDISRSLDVITFYYVNIIIRGLLFANSTINPILYNWLSTKFRRSFKKALGCGNNKSWKVGKNEIAKKQQQAALLNVKNEHANNEKLLSNMKIKIIIRADTESDKFNTDV